MLILSHVKEVTFLLNLSDVVSRVQSFQFTVDACASLAQSLAWLMPSSDANTASGKVR